MRGSTSTASTTTFTTTRSAGIERDRLQRWANKVGWETLLNRAGTTFKKLSDKEKEGISETKAISLMLKQPSMIKRPVLDAGGGKLLVGLQARTVCQCAGLARPLDPVAFPCHMRLMNRPLVTSDSIARDAACRGSRPAAHVCDHFPPDAGKTTLTEKLLLFGGAINLAGQVKAKRDRRSTRSDWMAIERERGISVVTSVMTFDYDGRVFNLLDTPGHEDFSEDTYRTLTAVDSAVMVIDAAKGIEARTRKLFEVCRLRDIPIITFINKMDRESRDPFELLDEIEKTLALDTAPMTWPIGARPRFRRHLTILPPARCGLSATMAKRLNASRSILPRLPRKIRCSMRRRSRRSWLW